MATVAVDVLGSAVAVGTEAAAGNPSYEERAKAGYQVRLPVPTGRYAVGTTDHGLTDRRIDAGADLDGTMLYDWAGRTQLSEVARRGLVGESVAHPDVSFVP